MDMKVTKKMAKGIAEQMARFIIEKREQGIQLSKESSSSKPNKTTKEYLERTLCEEDLKNLDNIIKRELKMLFRVKPPEKYDYNTDIREIGMILIAKNRFSEMMCSERWKQIRQLMIIKSGGCCEVCGFPSSKLVLHHKNYSSLFEEDIDDLQIVCRPCHRAIHGAKLVDVPIFAQEADVYDSVSTPKISYQLQEVNRADFV